MARAPLGRANKGRVSVLVACAAGLMIIVGGSVGLGTPSGAQEATDFVAFRGLATAAGERIAVSTPGARVTIGDDLLELSAPVVQAQLESGGLSTAFASAPYPGDFTVRAPGLVPALGVPVSPPNFPTFVEARYPDQSDRAMEVPGLSLHATAMDEAARASGQVGAPDLGALQVGSMVSTTSVEKVGPGKVVVSAESVVRGIHLADVMVLGSVTSKIVATKELGEDPVFEESMAITGATVAGQSVTMTGDGLILAEQNVGPPTDITKAVDSQLAAQGISIRVVDAPAMTDGKAARALQIVISRALSPSPQPGGPEGRVLVTLASVSAQVAGAGNDEAVPPDSLPSTPAAIGSPYGAETGLGPGLGSDSAGTASTSGRDPSISGPDGDGVLQYSGAGGPSTTDVGGEGSSERSAGGNSNSPDSSLPPEARSMEPERASALPADSLAAARISRQEIALTRTVDLPFVLLVAAAGLILTGATAWRRSPV